MSLDLHPFAVQAGPAPDPRPSPSLHLHLGSNNPFRNRAVSPASEAESSPSSPFARPATGTNHNNIIQAARPVSRNPFLDGSEDLRRTGNPSGPQTPPVAHVPTSAMSTSTEQTPFGQVAQDLSQLKIQGSPRGNGDRGPLYINSIREASLPGGHRPTKSHEEEARPYPSGGLSSPAKGGRPLREPRALGDTSDARPGRENRPPRRNSESSVVGVRSGSGPDPEGKATRDGRQRERKHADGRSREGASQGQHKLRRTTNRLDVIDKLDLTSIYGTGFHHDGPFDACNPHRNRKGSSRAPMKAFAKDSANNVIGGSGPLHKDIDRAQYFGDRGAEAFSDYSQSGANAANYEAYGENQFRPGLSRAQTSFNPISRVDPVHGDESLGLGTSTFLEGAPASQKAIQRRESESGDNDGNNAKGGGLTRKKSLVQKIRGLNQTRQYPGPARRTSNGDVRYDAGKAGTTSPREWYGPPAAAPASAGGVVKMNDKNPFFSDYDAAYDQKGESIAVAERKRLGQGNAPGSPQGPSLERKTTYDNVGAKPADENKSSGFLSRVRSLRGGRRQRFSERGT